MTKKPELALQTRTVLTSFVMASIGAAAVVGVGLMARPTFQGLPNRVVSATSGPAVVKANVSRTWAQDETVGIR